MTWKTGNADEFLEDTMDDKMTEQQGAPKGYKGHEHEWQFKGKIRIICGYPGCNAWMTPQEGLARLNATEKSGALKEALILALHLLGHANFKNGNTGPSGIIDEGEVHACRLMDKIEMLVPRLYANILEGKDG